MKSNLRDGLWRELEKIAADLAEAKERGRAQAAEIGDSPVLVSAFEQAFTEHMCTEGAARIRAVCDVYLVPKRRTRKAA